MNVFSGRRDALAACAVCAGVLGAGGAVAQTNDGEIGPGLVTLDSAYANGIERAAAAANDLVFRALDTDCNPGGVLDTLPAPTFGDIILRQGGPGPLCNPDTFHVYLNARELVHTANELQGSGPTVASLGLDQEGLGLALRWTAAEELSAQGAMATDIANGQLSTLAGRLTALRFGATGFGTAGRYEMLRRTSPMVAQNGGAAAPAPTQT